MALIVATRDTILLLQPLSLIGPEYVDGMLPEAGVHHGLGRDLLPLLALAHEELLILSDGLQVDPRVGLPIQRRHAVVELWILDRRVLDVQPDDVVPVDALDEGILDVA